MAILEKHIWVSLGSKNINYFQNKDYDIPRSRNRDGNLQVPRGTKIFVKIEDLLQGCGGKVTKICDECNIHIKKQPYVLIIKARNNGDGKDRCFSCARKAAWKIQRKVKYKSWTLRNKNKCISTTHPEIAKFLWNPADGQIYTAGSKKKIDFKCPECAQKVPDKIIHNIAKRGLLSLLCETCSDGKSYPEKFITNVFFQLKSKFKSQQQFHWAKGKRYDFFNPSLECIVEAHGRQHYEDCGWKTLKEEKENDRLKEYLANINGIKHYIVIDCRKSELEYIKNNIINSELSDMFDLRRIEWEQCHEYACKSFVKAVCEIWNSGNKNISNISKILNIGRTSVSRYLIQGSQIGWCDYKPQKREKCKRVVRLDLKNNYIDEFKTIDEAVRQFNIFNISLVCKNKQKTAGGFKWMYKDDYEKTQSK